MVTKLRLSGLPSSGLRKPPAQDRTHILIDRQTGLPVTFPFETRIV